MISLGVTQKFFEIEGFCVLKYQDYFLLECDAVESGTWAPAADGREGVDKPGI
jgi:hypothetical protein